MKRKKTISGLDKHGLKWRWRKTINGKPVSVVFEAASEQEAIAQVLEFQKSPNIHSCGLWERELTLHIRDTQRIKSISDHYAADRKQILTKAALDMHISKPTQLTRLKLEYWLGDVLARTERPATRNAYLVHMRQFVKWLLKNNKLYTNPTEHLSPIHAQFKPRNTFIEAKEVRNIIDAAKRTGDKELELILLLGFECGMRHGEISAARGSWIDLKRNTVTIPAIENDSSWSRKGRAGRRREVVIEMVKELRQWFLDNGVPEPYLLKPTQAKGKHMYRYDFKKKLRTHLKNCGHASVTIHDMRRSFGSNRIISGRTIEQVANWMGIHPNTAWQYYTRFTPNTGEIEHGSAASTAPIKTSDPSPPPEKSPLNSFSDLEKLRKENYITEAEYQEKRKKLIEEL